MWDFHAVITGTGTTTAWATADFDNFIAQTARVLSVSTATPTVSSGPQTLDLRFAMSTAVSGDAWTIDQIIMKRLQ
jgi:hypothetical protein